MIKHSSNNDPADQFAAEVSDAVAEILKTAIERTNGPGNATAALSVALTAMQQFLVQKTGADKFVAAIAATAQKMPADMCVELVQVAIDDAAQARAEATPTTYYGVA